jgi:hypothetical protein
VGGSVAVLTVVLAAALLAVRTLSGAWVSGTTTTDHPVAALFLLLTLSGLAWLGLVIGLRRVSPSRPALWFALLMGLALRLAFFGSTSVYEDDWQRYLWDGGVVAEGLDPYEYSPQTIREAAQRDTVEAGLQPYVALNQRSSDLTGRINNADLTTIYPPVAQAAFALAHWIAPFRLDGLRGVFLASDLLALGLLMLALSRFGFDRAWSLIYWLNPVAIFAVFNGGHMDGLLLPPLLAALLLARRRPALGGAALALAAAVKIWPLLLAPLLFRHLRTQWAKLAGVAGGVTGLTGLLLAPMVLSLSADAGLVAYSGGWTNSSFLFQLLRAGLDASLADGDAAARLTVALALVGLSLWFGLVSKDEPERIPRQGLLLVAALIWLSPTGYPWYLVWLLAFLPFAPTTWAAALFVGAGAYYVRFWLGEAGHYSLYRWGLVPLWYGVPLLLFAVSRFRNHDRHTDT